MSDEKKEITPQERELRLIVVRAIGSYAVALAFVLVAQAVAPNDYPIRWGILLGATLGFVVGNLEQIKKYLSIAGYLGLCVLFLLVAFFLRTTNPEIAQSLLWVVLGSPLGFLFSIIICWRSTPTKKPEAVTEKTETKEVEEKNDQK